MLMSNRIAIFIDGPNFYATCRELDFRVDYKKLLKEFSRGGQLVRAYYYSAIIESQEFVPIKPLLDWLVYNKFTVCSKPTKTFRDPLTGRDKTKGNMDVEMTVDMMKLASKRIDTIILFTGDGDFRALVQAVQELGIRVIVVSSLFPGTNKPPMIADELRRQADEFVELAECMLELADENSPHGGTGRR